MPTRNFRELLEAMPPDRQRRIENRFRKSLAAMPLDQLRKAQQMTQLQLAESLGVNQGEVSKIEHRRDRLNVTDQKTSSFATRLTLLPLQLQSLKANGINFISFTPGTTFDLKSRGGRVDERALIYRMLTGQFGIRSTPLFNLLQAKVSRQAWLRWA